LVAVAVNVVGVPAQMVVLDVLIDTDGTTIGLIVNVTTLEMALSGVAQAAFEINRQVITSLFVKVVELKEAELVPTTVPFLLHW
jgi:hypothetical protein